MLLRVLLKATGVALTAALIAAAIAPARLDRTAAAGGPVLGHSTAISSRTTVLQAA